MSIKVTTIIGDNYGSALQAYGFQCSLKKVGGGLTLFGFDQGVTWFDS